MPYQVFKKDQKLLWGMRLVMLIAVSLWVLVISITWGMAYFNAYPAVDDFFDIEQIPEKLNLFQMIMGLLITLLPIVPIAIGFSSVARFLKCYERGEIFHDTVIDSVRLLGYALIWCWLFLALSDTLMEMVLFIPNQINAISIPFPLDMEVIFLIVGILLVLLHKMLNTAQQIKKENDEII